MEIVGQEHSVRVRQEQRPAARGGEGGMQAEHPSNASTCNPSDPHLP